MAVRLLHVVARLALPLRAPRDAKRVTDAFGRLLPSFSTLDEARRAADILDRAGTCLSRALTVAACLPDSEVVIGVDPKVKTASPLFAHAWVEVRKRPIRPNDPQGVEMTRLRATAGSGLE